MAPAGTSLRQDDETLLVDCGTWSRSGVPRQKRHFVHRMAAWQPFQGVWLQERFRASRLACAGTCQVHFDHTTYLLGLSVLSQMQHVAVMQPHQSTSLNLNSPTSPDVTLTIPPPPSGPSLPTEAWVIPTDTVPGVFLARLVLEDARTPGARTPRRSRPAASASEEPRGSGCGGAGGFKAPVEVG